MLFAKAALRTCCLMKRISLDRTLSNSNILIMNGDVFAIKQMP